MEDIEKRLSKLEEDDKANRGDINTNTNGVKNNTSALELLHDFKEIALKAVSSSKMFFTMWIITFIAFISLLGYTLYLLNDIQKVTTTQEIEDVDTISGNIANGDING